MNISGLVSYDLRPSMSSYSQAPMGNMMPFHSHNYGYAPVAPSSYDHVVQSYGHGYPPHQTPHALQSNNGGLPGLSSQRDARAAYNPAHDNSLVKVEDGSQFRMQAGFYHTDLTGSGEDNSPGLETSRSENTFATDVDTLMKAIQSKARCACQTQVSAAHNAGHASDQPCGPGCSRNGTDDYVRSDAVAPSGLPLGSAGKAKTKRKYQCSIPECGKAFGQKTHLEIHMRAHTGVKPFLCKEPSCGQRFSQLGNLKTHERRHTGERPFQCELCGKRFAQRGNVRAHRIVHQHKKPFFCKLDSCGKQFTQLGNLKSHQNKFHAAALKKLTQKFASIHEIESVSPADREVWEYFAKLYKNSNKGIKGRGKDRKIAGSGLTASRSEIHSSASPATSYSSHSLHGGQAYSSDGMDAVHTSPVESSYLPQQRMPQHTGYNAAPQLYSYDGRKDY